MIQASKDLLRTRYRQLRRNHAAVLQNALDQSAVQQLLQWLPNGAQGPKRIGLSWPLPGEADLRVCLQAGPLGLALPSIEGTQLCYRPWSPGELLAPDACGIPAPLPRGPSLQPSQMALLLVPALAIDRCGVRLGYGGGWFDRLRADRAWREVPALVVVPAACVCERLPHDPWDVPFPGWLDEHGLHWI